MNNYMINLIKKLNKFFNKNLKVNQKSLTHFQLLILVTKNHKQAVNNNLLWVHKIVILILTKLLKKIKKDQIFYSKWVKDLLICRNLIKVVNRMNK